VPLRLKDRHGAPSRCILFALELMVAAPPYDEILCFYKARYIGLGGDAPDEYRLSLSDK
jgi:hypothetical protein